MSDFYVVGVVTEWKYRPFASLDNFVKTVVELGNDYIVAVIGKGVFNTKHGERKCIWDFNFVQVTKSFLKIMCLLYWT